MRAFGAKLTPRPAHVSDKVNNYIRQGQTPTTGNTTTGMTRGYMTKSGTLYFTQKEIKRLREEGGEGELTVLPEGSQMAGFVALHDAKYLMGRPLDQFVSHGDPDRKSKGNVLQIATTSLNTAARAGSIVRQDGTGFTGRLLHACEEGGREIMVGVDRATVTTKSIADIQLPFQFGSHVPGPDARLAITATVAATSSDTVGGAKPTALAAAGSTAAGDTLDAVVPHEVQLQTATLLPAAANQVALPTLAPNVFVATSITVGYLVAGGVDPRFQLKAVPAGNHLDHALSKQLQEAILTGVFIRDTAKLLKGNIDADLSQAQLRVFLPANLSKASITRLNAGPPIPHDFKWRWNLECTSKPFLTQAPDDKQRKRIIAEAASYLVSGKEKDTCVEAGVRGRDMICGMSDAFLRLCTLTAKMGEIRKKLEEQLGLTPKPEGAECARHYFLQSKTGLSPPIACQVSLGGGAR